MTQHRDLSCEEIDEHEIVERYVTGRLGAADAIRFEEHYLGCPTCTRAVEDAERLQRGLHGVAAEEIVRTTTFHSILGFLRSRRGAVSTALLVLLLLPLGLARREIGRLDAELGEIRGQLAEERRPRVDTPILTLVPTRVANPPPSPISLRHEPEWIVFAIPLGDDAASTYTATLTRSDGEPVRLTPSSAEAVLTPSYDGTLTLSLLSSLLPPGEYALELEASGDPAPTMAKRWRFPLRITRIPDAP